MRQMAWLWGGIAFSGCVGASAAVVGNAALNTAFGATVAGVRRAQGECYTPCNPGSACNKANGLCEPLPCGGQCRFDEHCQITAAQEKCVPRDVKLP
jgi:hypothetical protein